MEQIAGATIIVAMVAAQGFWLRRHGRMADLAANRVERYPRLDGEPGHQRPEVMARV
jgi:hypothetical protein